MKKKLTTNTLNIKLFKLALVLFGIHTLYAENGLSIKKSEELKETKLENCIRLGNNTKNKKEVFLKSIGNSLYYETIKVSDKNRYLNYAESYFILSDKCASVNGELLSENKSEPSNQLYKDLLSHSSLIKKVSTQLYKEGAIKKEVFDSHISTIETYDEYYASFRK